MYIISTVYDDNSAIVTDISHFNRIKLSESELIAFIKNKHNVIGASVSRNKLNYVQAYNCIMFPTDDEADDYIRSSGLSYKDKLSICGVIYVLEKNYSIKHVNYYVCTYKGDDVSYVSETGYTPYIEAAKIFNKKEAGEKAALMTKRSRTGTFWKSLRVEA